MDQTGDCWEWKGTKDADGYGRAWFEGGTRTAHRVAYRLLVGAIEPGLVLLHSCDNPGCVRPDHLTPGTIADNNHDMVSKGRQARGERSPRARLTAEQVEDIRFRFRNGDSRYSLAKRFGVTHRQVCYIVRSERWKDGVPRASVG